MHLFEKKLYLCSGEVILLMESVVKIASYICQRYLQEFGERIDEMKLHKLLYFTQKECLVQTGEPMFPEVLHAWRYGPVMPVIRQLYKEDALHDLPSLDTISQYKPVFDEVFRRLAGSSSMTLVSIAHGELSWKRARVGYGKYDSSDVPMKLEDIREDAKRYKDRIVKLRLLKGFLDAQGIKDHEGFLRSVVRTSVPVV